MKGDLRARRIAYTMRAKRIDNFHVWRERMRRAGEFGTPEERLERSGDLAELIGLVLGDGNIGLFPRTERLVIAGDARKPEFLEWCGCLIKKLFNKEPKTIHTRGSNARRISMYQKGISRRLGIPTGNRSRVPWETPRWIRNNSEYLRRLLRGLYEAEGSFCVHRPTSTYKFIFSNKNVALLDTVFDGLIMLGFHPHRSLYQVQLSRKAEVFACKNLLEFRKYSKM